MKHLLKRTLALMLAVLMVAGTLPTTAWAARIVDGPVRETPVLDDDGQVADVLGRPDQGEKPIDPVDPGANDPAAPSWDDMTITNVTVRSDGTWSLTVHSDKGASSSVGNWSLLLIPDVKHPSNAAAVRPSQMRHDTGDAEVRFNKTDNAAGSALTGLARNTGMTDTFLVLQTNAGSFGADGNFTLTSEDWGKVKNYETLQASIGTFVDIDGKKVSDMATQIPFLAVFYSQGGTPDICYAEPKMVYENTNFELVPSTTFIDSAKTNVFSFTLHNATKDDVDNGLASVEAGVPSYVDKITFVGTLKGETDETTIVFDVGNNGLVALDDTNLKSVYQAAAGTGSYRDSTGTITVEYHKNGAPGEKKSIAITVRPVPTGEIVVTPITLTLKAGDDTTTNTKSGSTTITNGTDYTLGILSPDDANTWGGLDVYESILPETIPGGLNVTPGTIPYHGIQYLEDEMYYILADGEGVASGGGTMTINNIITVTAPRGTAKGTYNFELSLNGVDDGTGAQVEVKVPVTVIVEVDKEWTVTFDENYTGKPTPMHSVTVADGDVVSGYYPSRTGYGLVGWYSDAACTDGNEVSFPYTPTGDITVYAKWEQDITYSVTYQDSATSGDPQLTTSLPSGATGLTPGTAVTVSASPAKNAEMTNGSSLYYKFVGWNDGTATRDPGYKFNISKDTTLTAVWEVVNITVTLANGGHGTIPSGWPKTIQKGSATTLPTLTATGWTFGGWAAPAGGTDVGASGGSTGALTQDTTYTAKWTQNDYTLTWNANGGQWTSASDTTKTETKHYGDSISAYATAPTRTGWIHSGWSETDDGSAVTFPQTMPAAAKTYYAVWTQGQSTIHYDWNYTGGATVDHTGNTSAADTAPTSAPSRTGYTWDGKWYTTNACTTAVSTFTFPAAVDGEVTYYAKWTANTYNVTYDLNSGSNPSGVTITNGTFTYGSDYTIPSTYVPTRANYVFTGWLASGGVSGTKTAGSAIGCASATADVTLTAQWKGQSSVNFNNNYTGNNTNYNASTGDTGASVPAASIPANPTRTGYTFTGWFTAATGGSQVAPAAMTYPTTVGATTTYYAHWSARPATVTVTVQLDGANSDSPVGSGVTLVNGSETITLSKTATGTYSSAAVTTNEDSSSKTYEVHVNGVDTGETVAVTPGSTGTAEVKYWTVTLTAGTGATAPKVNTANGSLVVLNGTTGVTLSASAQTYYNVNAATWTRTAGATQTAASTTGSTTLNAITATTTYSVAFAKLKANITVNFSVDGTVGWPTGYTSIAVTGPDGAAWSASSTDTSKVYSLDQGNSYTVTSGSYSQTINPLTAAGATVTIPYYTMTATTNTGHGKVKVESGALSAETTNAANSSVSIVVPYHANVTWTATADANYIVNAWNGTADTATTKSESSVGAAVTKTVAFSKNRFNTYLKLNVNGTHQNAFSSSHNNIKNLELVTANNGTTAVSGVTVTHDNTNQVWAATGVPSTASPYWRVTTVDNGVYYTAANVADKTTDVAVTAATATMNLFGVQVAAGGYGNTTNKPYLKAAGTTRVVMPRSTNASVNANPDTGYAWASWVQNDDSAVPNTVTVPSGATGNVSLAAGYTSNADLVLKPTYTFSATVKTQYGGNDTAPGGDVVLKSTEADKTLTGTGGSYSVTGLTPGVTYTVWVNGFNSGVTVTAPGTTAVTLYRVSVVKDPTASTGTAYINLGASASGTASSIYVPKGGSSSDEDAPGIHLAAAPRTATDAATGYRLKNLTGETLWTTTGQTLASATNATTTVTVANMAADVTVTAHYVEQYTAHTSVDPTTGGTSAFTTEANSGAGTSASGADATVDKNGYVKATFTPSVGNTLSNWTFANGDLYTNAAKTSQLTSGATTTATTVYFFPTATNATLVANTVAATYPVTVTVNLDNGAYTGRTVQLRQSNTVKYTLTAGTGANAGKYTGNVLPGTYDIYVDGVTTNTMADTQKDLDFEAKNATVGNDDYDATKLAATVNYYTVNLVAGTGGKVDFTNTAASAAKASASQILLATTAARNAVVHVAAKPDDAANAHYRFDGWTLTPSGTVGSVANATQTGTATTYSLPAEAALAGNNNIDSTHQITITASFQKQFRVTVAADTGLTATVRIKKNDGSTTDWSSTALVDTSILVDEGESVLVGYRGNTNTARYFKDWTATEDTGTFAAASGNAAAKPTGTGKLPRQAGKPAAQEDATAYHGENAFYPTADSTVTLHFWTDATRDTASWTYTKGNVGSGDNTASNLKKLTWTPNDAQRDTATPPMPKVTIEVRKGSTTATPTTLATGNYTAAEAGGKVTYTLTDTYLNNLTPDTYYVTIKYTLGTDGHANTYALSKDMWFTVALKEFNLTSTDIQVRDTSKTTLNVDSTGTQDVAEYKSHAHTNIDPLNTLTLKWFWADTAPAKRVLTATEIANINAATPTYPGGATWHPLTGTEGFTGTGTTYTAIPNYDGGTNNTIKGKYVFAVATASTTGTGSVITNALPVDYDATITVNVDGSKTSTNDFKVYLRPVAADGTASTANRVETSDIEASWNGTTQVYETTGSKLTGGVTYQVWVNEVSGVTTGTNFHLLNTNKTVTPAVHAAAVDFYTVTLVNVNAGKVTDAQDDSATPQDVGENFNNVYPTLSAAVTGTTRSVASGAAVLTGTSVTAKSTNWTQDYTMTWQKQATGDTSLVDWATKQNNTAAVNTGYAYGAVDKAVTITAKLTQNTYTITGDIKDVNGETGQRVASATLTVVNGGNTYVFKNLTTGFNGQVGSNVQFTVPKSGVTGAINGTYTISAVAAANSTIQGYSVPAKTVAEWKAAGDSNGVAVGTAPHTGKFTIFTAATTLRIKVEDDDSHSQENGNVTTPATAAHTSHMVIDNYSATTDGHNRTVTVSNTGNTPLTVTMGITKGVTAILDGSTTIPASKVLTDTTASGTTVTFGGMERSFTLAAGESKSFTVTLTNDLEVQDSATYTFAFTSVDGRPGVTAAGPQVNFNLTLDVKPVTIGRVTTTLDTATNTYSVAKHWLQEDAIRQGATDATLNTFYSNDANSAESLKAAGKDTSMDRLVQQGQGTPAATAANADIYYRWYVADCSDPTHVHLDTTNGDLTTVAGGHTHSIIEVTGSATDNGRSFTPLPAHYGKSLYLVAVGQGNATYAVMTPDSTRFAEDPVPIPFQGEIKIYQDGTLVTDQTTLNKYTVELRDAADATKKFPASVVATATAGAYIHQTAVQLEQGHTYQVWASAMESDATTLINTGETITVSDTGADVYFYLVSVEDTKIHQNDYDAGDRLGVGSTNDTTLFYHNGTRNKPSATGSNTGATSVDGKYVLKGTTVTFTYDHWDKDYDLTWSGGVTGTDTAAAIQANAANNAVKTLTYNAKKDAVKTELKLNLYNVEAHVTGSVGHVGYIDMTLTEGEGASEKTYIFTTKDGEAGKIWGTSPKNWNNNIKISETAVFRLPKADGYVVSGKNDVDTAAEFAGYTYNSTTYDYVAGPPEQNATVSVNVTGNATLDQYDVRLKGDGLAMRVKGDVPASLNNKNLVSPATTSVGGQATILPTGDDRTPAGSAATDTVYLNYNYGQDLTVIVTASNESKQGDDANASTLKDVTFAAGAFDAAKFAVADNKFATAKDLGRTGTSAADWKGASDTVTLTIKQGLAVGTHTFTGTFTFKDSGTPQEQNTVTYTLNVIVEPLAFTGVTIQDKAGATDGTLTIDQYVATRKAEGTETGAVALTATSPAATSSQADANTALVKDSDYGYQWISTATGVTTPNIASVDASGNLTPSGTANYTVIGGATNREYTPVAADEGRNLYLVIYGTDNATGTRHNATSFAVSSAKVNTYSGIVYLNVDGTVKSGAADGTGYTVEFIDLDTPAGTTPTPISTNWKNIGGGVYAYVADLAPNTKGYKAQVSRAKGDANLIDLTATITGVNIGTELGHDPAYTNVTVANYFTVTANPFSNTPYQTGTGETFTSSITPALSLGGAALTSGTPVLSGQSVAAKAGATWTQDYALTWQTGATVAGLADTTPANQAPADAVKDNAYTQTVSATTVIGGVLKQNTYTIIGSVVGAGTVDRVILKGGTGNKGYGTAAGTGVDITANNAWTDTDNSGTHNAGDTVSFKVVKGTYTITAYDGANTTIQKVTVDGGTAMGSARNTNILTDVATDTRAFTVHLEATDLQLGVTDDQGTPKSALSTVAQDHKHADNVQVIYFDGTNTTDPQFALTLNNPGNADLSVTASVYKLAAGTNYANMGGVTLGAAIGNTGDAVVSITGLGTSAIAVAKGAGVTGSGVNAVGAGTLTLDRSAANTADAVYVVKFASKVTNTDGVETDGPTVYYVFDLTVKPLPIKQVDTVTENDRTIHLMGYDSTDAANKTGLDHVWVDDDDDATNANVTAVSKALTDGTSGDIKYAWAKAATDVTVDESKFTLTGGTLGLASGVTDVELIAGQTGKSYKPQDTEQGMNIYLIAYSAGDTANASGFAVSDVAYAQVEIELKTQRKSDSSVIADTEVQIAGVYGANAAVKSNSGKITVTGADETIGFTADLTDVTHKDTTNTPPVDDPNSAKYYFVGWGATNNANITAGADPLAMTYSVTGKDTVIGYYDLLPKLANPGGYNKESGKDVPANRTFTYTKNDGDTLDRIVISGNIEDESGTLSPVTVTLKEPDFAATDFALPAGGWGASGEYVISENWIKNVQKLAQGMYTVTFYDSKKGASADGGYAGYDPYVAWTITEGEKSVTARVKDTKADGETTPVYWGKVTISNSTPEEKTGTSVSLNTAGGTVNLVATPNDGYVFEKWVRVDTTNTGSFGTDGSSTTKNPTTFSARQEAVVEASFLPADYTATEGKAKVYYGNTAFEANTATETENLVDIAVTPGVNTQSFTYSLLSETELTAYLTAQSLTRTDKMYTTDGYTSGTDTLGKIPAWLDFNTATGVVSVKTGEKATGVNVRKNGTNDVNDELIVYVKVEEDHTHVTKIVPFTVDIMTTPLKIVTNQTADSTAQTDGEKTAEGAAYKAAYIGAYGSDGTAPDAAKVDGDATTGKIIHGGDVELGKFAFTSVVSTKNAADELIAAGSATETVTGLGTWTVAPAKFNGGGTDPDQNSATYTFTFTYTGAADDPSDDYNYAGSAVDAVIPVQRPARSLEFGDALKVAGDLQVGTEYSAPWTAGDALPTALDYTTNTFRKGETLTYLDGEPTYTVKLKRVGSLKDITLTVDPEEGKTTAGFKAPNDLAAIAAKLNADGAETTFELTLAPVHGNVWVGEHYIRFKLSGKDDLGADVTAYYTVSLTVAPKTITALDVKVTDPDTTPTEVKGTTDDNKPVDNNTPDGKGNVPIKDVTVTWGPENGPDGKHTEVTITVETDPNYVYVPDDPTDPDQNIDKHTEVTVKETVEGGGTTNRPTPAPDVTRDSDTKVTITQPIPYLMHSDLKDGSDPADATGPKVNDSRAVSVMQGAKDLGSYTIDLGAYGGDVHNVEWTIGQDTITSLAGENGIGATLGALPSTIAKIEKDGAKQQVVLDLTTADTSKPGTYTLTLIAKGKADPADGPDEIIQSTYTFQLTIRSPGGGGPVEPPCPCKVLYYVGSHGVTEDATIEDVSEKNRPSKVPAVTALDGYVFRGWSLTNPATLKSGEKLTLVDPKTVEAKGETMTFYAVIVERPFHEHYVIGYPNGNFGPADNINRASVATIIARAILPDFVEGANYGNPGNYSDVSGHWAESAIAYCSKFGVFEGYTDGTFRPDQPITRQEFALVIARLDGVMTPGEMDFTDIDEAGQWALGGIYTAYAKGWINGYTDGTFKPLNNIRRDEAVKVFNAYLNRGVDADGLSDLHEYVHSGAASNVTGNGENEYMTWPDVPKDHWAYYEIVEAANDHQFEVDFESELGHGLPEKWEKCWIDERWRYNDDQTDNGANAALASAAFGVGLH